MKSSTLQKMLLTLAASIAWIGCSSSGPAPGSSDSAQGRNTPPYSTREEWVTDLAQGASIRRLEQKPVPPDPQVSNVGPSVSPSPQNPVAPPPPGDPFAPRPDPQPNAEACADFLQSLDQSGPSGFSQTLATFSQRWFEPVFLLTRAIETLRLYSRSRVEIPFSEYSLDELREIPAQQIFFPTELLDLRLLRPSPDPSHAPGQNRRRSELTELLEKKSRKLRKDWSDEELLDLDALAAKRAQSLLQATAQLKICLGLRKELLQNQAQAGELRWRTLLTWGEYKRPEDFVRFWAQPEWGLQREIPEALLRGYAQNPQEKWTAETALFFLEGLSYLSVLPEARAADSQGADPQARPEACSPDCTGGEESAPINIVSEQGEQKKKINDFDPGRDSPWAGLLRIAAQSGGGSVRPDLMKERYSLYQAERDYRAQALLLEPSFPPSNWPVSSELWGRAPSASLTQGNGEQEPVRILVLDSGVDWIRYPELGLDLALSKGTTAPDSESGMGDLSPPVSTSAESRSTTFQEERIWKRWTSWDLTEDSPQVLSRYHPKSPLGHGTGVMASLLTSLAQFAPDALVKRRFSFAHWKVESGSRLLTDPFEITEALQVRSGIYEALWSHFSSGVEPQIISYSRVARLGPFLKRYAGQKNLFQNSKSLWVMAAGNEGQQLEQGNPACALEFAPVDRPTDRILCVGAISKGILQDQIATYSNTGDPVDLYTYDAPSELCPSGTSCSTPVVAAWAAGLLADHPEWSAEMLKQELLKRTQILRLPRAQGEGLLSDFGLMRPERWLQVRVLDPRLFFRRKNLVSGP